MLSNLCPVVLGLAIGFGLDAIVREESTIIILIELIKREIKK